MKGFLSIVMSEKQMDNFLNDKDKAKEQAEHDDLTNVSYIYETSDVELDSFSVRENYIEISTESSDYGQFYIEVSSELKLLLSIVNQVHKKINKMKSILEGLK